MILQILLLRNKIFSLKLTSSCQISFELLNLKHFWLCYGKQSLFYIGNALSTKHSLILFSKTEYLPLTY